MNGLTTLYNDVRAIVIESRSKIYATINRETVEACWKIERRIVEEDQAW